MSIPIFKRELDGSKTSKSVAEVADLNAAQTANNLRFVLIENQLPDDDTALINAIAENAAAIAAEMSATDGDVDALMALILGNTQATNTNASGLANLIQSLPDFATFASQVDLDSLESSVNTALAALNGQVSSNQSAISALDAAIKARLDSFGLTQLFSGGLSSATQNTNGAITVYDWAGTFPAPLAHNAGRITSSEKITLSVSSQVVVTDGTANDRATFELKGVKYDTDETTVLANYALNGAYIRDDNANFDSGVAGASFNVTLLAGQSFEIMSMRLDSQDPTDDNPANATRSFLTIDAWSL